MRTEQDRQPTSVRADPTVYGAVRDHTECLADPLGPEDQVVQSMPDCSPTKWHRAHTTWFFETFLLGPHHRDHTPVDPSYAYLFNSYYEAAGPRHARPRRGLITRPTVDEVTHYRRQVDSAMHELLDRLDDLDPTVADLVDLGLHHEQQHQELLLMDAKHLLFQNPTQPAYDPGSRNGSWSAAHTGWIEHGGGMVEIGADTNSFSFDNEGPRHTVRLEPFRIADRPVTCGEWADFIADGGYRRAEFWLSDGWATVNAEGWNAPLYWDVDQRTISVFTLGGTTDIDPGEPVTHVSYYEADAYARWAGARLPTEFEWEAALGDIPVTAGRRWSIHPSADSLDADPMSVYSVGWQWTASAYSAYPRFRVADGAVGEYNGKFMVNQHVLRGGACVTPDGHARPTYRNFFPPAARWPFTSVRLAADA